MNTTSTSSISFYKSDNNSEKTNTSCEVFSIPFDEEPVKQQINSAIVSQSRNDTLENLSLIHVVKSPILQANFHLKVKS